MRYIALDTETGGLNAKFDASVPLWMISFTERGSDGQFISTVLPGREGLEHIRSLLHDTEVTFVLHNAAFDIAVLRTRGCDIPSGRYVDSALAAYCLRPGQDVSLETLSSGQLEHKVDVRESLNSLGYSFKNAEEVFSYNYDEDRKAYEVLAEYCKKDTEATLVLWERVSKELHADTKLSKNYYYLELPFVEAIIEMEHTGLYIDKEAIARLKKNLERRIACLDKVMLRMVPRIPSNIIWVKDHYEVGEGVTYAKGFYKNKRNIQQYYTDVDGNITSSEATVVYNHCDYTSFNPNSSRHLAYVLMQQGWQPEKFTPSGEPATDAEVVDNIELPLARVFSARSEYAKLLNTFVEGLLNATDASGFCHGSYNQMVTKTTRLSSSSPNLMNLPARTVLGAKIRQLIIAPPGYDIIVGDLDQVEGRVLAYYLERVMHESRMADGIRAGKDMHQSNADAWGVSRKAAKGGLFALLYGAQPKKMSQTLHISITEAENIVNSIMDGMPAIQELKESVWRAARNRGGVIYTLLGSRLTYDKMVSNNKWDRLGAERQCFNALIQGTAANINKELTLRAMYYMRQVGAKLATQCHDESVIYCPTEHTQWLIDRLNEVFHCTDICDTKEGGVPITATFCKGNNWKDAKEAG